ncbi:MAG: PmoA family protein [Flavisolibacter sp.]
MKFIFLLALFFVTAASAQNSGFRFVDHPEQKQVNLEWNGKLLTAYCYYDSVRKPFLFPLNTVDGITITRGYPVEPRPGERTDHPHHTGMWLNYESVNGLDFWNNSTAIAPEKRNGYGSIKHTGILAKKTSDKGAVLVTTADWVHPDGHVLMKEQTVYVFTVKNNDFNIERVTTLTAQNEDVVFKDAKDGLFAIRVARELEMPSTQEDVFLDIHGNKTTVKQMSNEGVTGMYYNDAGVKGDSVWSTKGRWCMLQGVKQGKKITIGIFDHPHNPGYPTYWHARGYGLFAANPLGRKIFSNGKEELNYTLHPHASVTFRYKVMIASDREVSAQEMNQKADAFAKEK